MGAVLRKPEELAPEGQYESLMKLRDESLRQMIGDLGLGMLPGGLAVQALSKQGAMAQLGVAAAKRLQFLMNRQRSLAKPLGPVTQGVIKGEIRDLIESLNAAKRMAHERWGPVERIRAKADTGGEFSFLHGPSKTELWTGTVKQDIPKVRPDFIEEKELPDILSTVFVPTETKWYKHLLPHESIHARQMNPPGVGVHKLPSGKRITTAGLSRAALEVRQDLYNKAAVKMYDYIWKWDPIEIQAIEFLGAGAKTPLHLGQIGEDFFNYTLEKAIREAGKRTPEVMPTIRQLLD